MPNKKLQVMPLRGTPELRRWREKTCFREGVAYTTHMVTLNELQKQADELSSEDRAGLVHYLVERLPDAPMGPDDDEVARRERDLESGEVSGITHDAFRREVGR